MSNVSFEEERQYVHTSFARTSRKGLRGLVIKWGWAKDDAGAEKILLIVAGAALIVAISTTFLLGGENKNTPIPKAKIDAALTIPQLSR